MCAAVWKLAALEVTELVWDSWCIDAVGLKI
jgi:hypothetical protein